MSLSPRDFRQRLYEEHLDELAFLWGQCVALRADDTRSWLDTAGHDERREAHLDALVIGAPQALSLALALAAEGEAGFVFGAAALVCRLADAAALQQLLKTAPPDDPVVLEALTEAFVREWPAAWQAAGLRSLAEGDSRLAPALAAVAACRQWPAADALSLALARATPGARPALLAALGRVAPAGDSLATLQAGYASAEAGTAAAALHAGLLQQDELARQRVLADPAHAALWPLAAPAGTAPPMLAALKADEPDAVRVRTLGQLGELSAVRTLTALLENEAVAGAAALSLQLITGAGLREQVFVPAPVDEDACSEAELRQWREQGQAPRRADGQPYGEQVDRLSQDPAAWGQWLVDHGGRFQAGRRYRLGQPCTPGALLASVGADSLPARGRRALVDELASRHGLRLPWDERLPVAAQAAVLRRAGAAAAELESAAGQWYWAGRALG